MFEKEFPQLAEAMERAGSDNRQEADAGFADLAEAVQQPVREAIFPGNLFQDLFTMERWDGIESPYYLTDLVQPGQEANFKAYAVPAHGELPRNFAQPRRLTSRGRRSSTSSTTCSSGPCTCSASRW